MYRRILVPLEHTDTIERSSRTSEGSLACVAAPAPPRRNVELGADSVIR